MVGSSISDSTTLGGRNISFGWSSFSISSSYSLGISFIRYAQR